MTYRLRLLPEVEGDARIGHLWYEERSPGLGDDFLGEFYRGTAEIATNPLLCRTVHGAIRRRLLHRFPYSVYFTLEDDVVLVLGLFHCARDPQTIDEELRRREE